MTLYHHPQGGRLSALEKNILIYRAIEMVLVLFYAESLKSFIIESLRMTERFRDGDGAPADLAPGGNQFRKAMAGLVRDGIVSQEESDEIRRLIDHRNDVAHRVYNLVADISHLRVAKDLVQFGMVKYDYDAMQRLKRFYDDIPERMSGRYVQPISFNGLIFEAAEKTYKEMLKRLRKKIEKQLLNRRLLNRKLRAELRLEGPEFAGKLDPWHPQNKMENGRLTKRGAEICYRLFDAGRSPLAVAYIMRLTYPSSVARHKAWIKSGMTSRTRLGFSAE